ncbi:MAG: hypothetical protein K0Q50_194 [Vampirovibrio sp.]|jgi:hypothetical protein|nr:hypothetical protein [Vampirovibrio sp.]
MNEILGLAGLAVLGYLIWYAVASFRKAPEQFIGKVGAGLFLFMAFNVVAAIAFQISHWDHFMNWNDEDSENGGAFTLAFVYIGIMWLTWQFGKTPVKDD